MQIGLLHVAFESEYIIVFAENDGDLSAEARYFGINLTLRSSKLDFQINIIELDVGFQCL